MWKKLPVITENQPKSLDLILPTLLVSHINVLTPPPHPPSPPSEPNKFYDPPLVRNHLQLLKNTVYIIKLSLIKFIGCTPNIGESVSYIIKGEFQFS